MTQRRIISENFVLGANILCVDPGVLLGLFRPPGDGLANKIKGTQPTILFGVRKGIVEDRAIAYSIR